MDIINSIMKLFWKNTEKNDNKRISKQKVLDGITEIKNVPYINDFDKYHRLDVYFQEGKDNENLPLIIDVHGGGWMYGTKEINKNFCYSLASRGFCVISVNYRLAGNPDEIHLNNQIDDVLSAISFVSKNASNYPIDLDNAFLVGDSAGGQMVCLVSIIQKDKKLQKMFKYSSKTIDFKAIGAVSPVTDMITPNITMSVNHKIILGKNYKSSRYYKLLDLSNVMRDDLPPFYVVTSSGDFIEKQSIKFDKLLSEYGVEHLFRDEQEKFDGKKLPHVYSVLNPCIKPSQIVLDEMTKFFKSKMVVNKW